MPPLPDIDALQLGHVTDLPQLLRAIADIAHNTYYIYLEDPASDEVVRFLDIHQDAPAPMEVERGTLWPRPKTFHLRASRENMSELIAFSDRMSAVEVAEHLLVYDKNRVLIEAYDVGDSYVRVNRALGPDSIKRLLEAVDA